MTQATLELYTALVEAGVPKDKAEKAAQTVISREEAKEFATKGDIGSVEGSIKRLEGQIKMLIMVVFSFNSAILVTLLIK